MLLDGATKVTTLPPVMAELIEQHSTAIARLAVLHQQEEGTALDDLLGIICVDQNATETETTFGVARRVDILGGLRGTISEKEGLRLDRFLEQPVPLTHLRTVICTPWGVAHVRIDVVPAQMGGAS